ncbi:MAG: winged helix-turn-helix domain-containing protein, partial [Myxococcota bacterium]
MGTLVWLRGCEVELATGRLSGGATGRLSERERALLAYLVERPLEVVPRTELVRRVFGYSPGARTRAVDKAMYGLRQKVERSADAPEHLLTCFGEGYQFVPLDQLPAAAAPAVHGDLVGRDADVQRLLDLLDLGPVAVRGPVGVGKSAVAREVARRWGARGRPTAWCVPGDGGWVAQVGAAVGLVGLVGERPTAAAVAGRLRGRDGLLVVLDDLDPSDALPELDRWRAAAPEVRWLVTGTAAPASAREHLLAPLSVPDGAALLVRRAAERGCAVGEADGAALAARLDGLPLAIELVCARLPTFGLAALSDPSRSPLDIVEGRALSLPARHSSLRCALAGPWAALSDVERRVLGRRAHAPAPLDLAEIEALTGGAPEASLCGVVDRLE